MNEENTTTEPKKSKNAIPIFLAVCMFLAIILSLALLLFMNESKPFMKVNIQQTLWDNTEFVNNLSNLELAERQTTELVERSETPIFDIPWWGETALSSAEYEVRFKVLYTYVISTDKQKWKFDIQDDVVYISCPEISVRPPAVDTASIEGRFKGGWLVTKESDKLEALKKSVTAIASSRATDKRHLSIVREQCRKSVEQFIYSWFIKGRYEVKDIRVKFADERNFGILDDNTEERKLN